MSHKWQSSCHPHWPINPALVWGLKPASDKIVLLKLLLATSPQPPALCLATSEVLLPFAWFRIKNVSFLAFPYPLSQLMWNRSDLWLVWKQALGRRVAEMPCKVIECAWQGYLVWISYTESPSRESSFLRFETALVTHCGFTDPCTAGEVLGEYSWAHPGLCKGHLWNVKLVSIPSWCLMFVPALSVTSSSNVLHLKIHSEICLHCQLCSSSLLSKKPSCVLSAPSVIPSPCWQGGFRMETWLLTRRLKHGMGMGLSCALGSVQILGESSFLHFLRRSTCRIPSQALF